MRILAVLLLALAAAPVARAAAPLRLGYFDGVFSTPQAGPWLARARDDGASVVRLLVRWADVAPTAPADAADPGDPAYRWAALDAAVTAARAQGLDVLVTVFAAPSWAEGAGRPAGAMPGAWRPSAAAFEQFARAAARRYSGAYAGLPRVRYWQPWNEPNLPRYLDGDDRPALYRGLLNGFYAGVKASAPGDLVVAAGTSPYGDHIAGGARIPPVTFWRRLLAAPTRFDAWAHHPYGVGGPRTRAVSPDDAAVPDVGRIGRVVASAVRRGRALPRKHKPGWITELAWDSRPPDPHGVPAARQARWLEGAFYVLWRQGVDTITWYQIGDSPPVPSYDATNQGGTHFLDGRPKPSASAFRFPFTAYLDGAGRAALWGAAPRPGAVVVERRAGGRWRTIARLRAGAGRVFLRRVRMPRGALLRARAGGEVSLTWRVGHDG